MRRIILSFVISLCCFGSSAQEWRYAGHAPRSRWSQEIKNPDRANWEYPRPQMLRSRWMHLNGSWKYVVSPRDAETMPPTERRIFVPFPLESPLSGAGRTILERDALWYSRTFVIPDDWKGETILLHFGAVDRECDVFVNGIKAGSHSGSGSFTLDISDHLVKKGENALVVKVFDGIKEGGRSVTGIWQTVWLEPVNAKARIDSCTVRTDISAGTLSITPVCTGIRKGDRIQIYVFDDDAIIADVSVFPGETAAIRIPGVRIWAPGAPALYDFSVNLFRGSKLLDIVRCYTAFRSPDSGENAAGATVDAVWWSDGFCTPPSDEALLSELKEVRSKGPGVIYHTAYPTARTRYWCDVLGIMLKED